ncbi:unnamed protein product [Urochloa decumbens]|uniref:DUF4378 domain-containing protein n=1 Tax=Urochloa decumbens TaxID=240449 RepID=A0ABC8YDP3_9POAL
MAPEGAGGAPTPLRLKDLLELDCDSCSAAGFRCYPRRLGESPSAAPAAAMRRLLESPSSLRRRHPSKLSSLSRSLSRRLLSRGSGFWLRRRGENDEVVAAAAPSGSELESRACSSETTSTSDDNSSTGRRRSPCGSDSDLSTASSASTSDSMDAAAAVAGRIAAGDELEGMKRGSGSSSVSEADDKEEQLSPVAVMDFPSDDDDCACSPSFSLARLQRRKTLRPQHKIRRFGSTEELGPVDLESLLAATSDADDDPGDDVPAQQCRTEEAAAVAPRCHEPDEHGLLALLLHAAAAGADHVSQRLLLDFFVEMTRRQRGSMERSEELSAPTGLLVRRKAEQLEQGGDGEVLAAAKGWLDGAGSGRWGLNDVLRGGEAVVAEMERGRRWMQVGEEEREIGAVVAGVLADQLVDEVVWDLLV